MSWLREQMRRTRGPTFLTGLSRSKTHRPVETEPPGSAIKRLEERRIRLEAHASKGDPRGAVCAAGPARAWVRGITRIILVRTRRTQREGPALAVASKHVAHRGAGHVVGAGLAPESDWPIVGIATVVTRTAAIQRRIALRAPVVRRGPIEARIRRRRARQPRACAKEGWSQDKNRSVCRHVASPKRSPVPSHGTWPTVRNHRGPA